VPPSRAGRSWRDPPPRKGLSPECPLPRSRKVRARESFGSGSTGLIIPDRSAGF
jgi:hypothetical protein